MNEKGVEGRLRAAVANEIRATTPQTYADALRSAHAAIAVVLDQAAEQIKALTEFLDPRTGDVLLSKPDVLGVLAELRGDDA